MSQFSQSRVKVHLQGVIQLHEYTDFQRDLFKAQNVREVNVIFHITQHTISFMFAHIFHIEGDVVQWEAGRQVIIMFARKR